MKLEDGGFSVEVIKDSITEGGSRITTVVSRYPRFIHAEEMTHKEYSKNAASSRAIPVNKLIEMVENEPVIPIWWGKNEPGMQAYAELDDAGKAKAKELWLTARDYAVMVAKEMVKLGLHKQIVNRIIEPWMWITIIKTGTAWNNYRALRVHPAAEPHMQKIARMTCQAVDASTPEVLRYGEWHLPFVIAEDQNEIYDGPNSSFLNLVKFSVARCARVSYLNHEGKRDIVKDLALHDQLMVQTPLHASPAEHQAKACKEAAGDVTKTGNLRGEWYQYRKMFVNEYVK